MRAFDHRRRLALVAAPSGRAVTYGTAAILLVLGVLLVAAREAIPGLTIPGEGSMNPMMRMDP